MSVTLPTTIGALLLGSWCSIAIWGAMSYQSFIFFRQPGDRAKTHASGRMRLMVTSLWILDTLHIIFAMHAIYWYLVSHFNEGDAVHDIIWSLPVTIAITAAITFIVQMFFAQRIYILSQGQKLITLAIMITATARVIFGTMTTVRAIILRTFPRFNPLVRFYVTTGLALSVVTDLLITGTLCFFLSRYRTGFTTDNLVDKIIRWTIQTGAMTTFVGVLSMATAIAMPKNLVWLGIHMLISKLYTTMTIAHLNSRELARDRRARDAEANHGLRLRQLSISVPGSGSGSSSDRERTRERVMRDSKPISSPQQVSILVEQQVYVERDVEDESDISSDKKRMSYLAPTAL